ncbi:hypothetical protein EYZ11_007024 [Aspergillus tanneri]|uniref:Uncharacterized protein n=1 Tax=Aspergillus tanneri TaxID=1220188 RepID=A0A4S3JEB2_9EURO|nr:hypothetical protein EYZ11_007024 [Aspergillus tanneri]
MLSVSSGVVKILRSPALRMVSCLNGRHAHRCALDVPYFLYHVDEHRKQVCCQATVKVRTA